MSHSRTIPESWQWTTLGEIAKTSSGGTPRRSITEYFGGSIPWVKIGDLNDDVIAATEETITDAGVAESSATVLPAGTLLIAMYGSIGKLGVLGMEAATNQAICALQPTPSVSRDFLYWLLRAQRAELLHAGFGGTQANISQTFLRKLPVVLPPRAEQDRIVEALGPCLARVDEGTDDVRDALARLPQLRAACLAAAFDKGDMEFYELDDLATIQSGITKSPPKDTDLIAVPYIRTANVQAGYLDLKEIKELKVTEEQRARHLLQAGDVLVLEGGDADKVGRGWIWADEVPGAIHQNHVFAVRPDPERLDSRYLAYYVNAPQARAYFLSKAKQTTNLASINKAQLRALPTPTPTPSVESQREIVQRLDRELAAITALHQVVAQRLNETQTLQRAVLVEAFQGRLVAQDPADEPASELLELTRDEAGAADLNTEGAAL
jgi:type I restriction enzyme, S subunit